MDFNLFNSIILAGIVQGLIFSGVVLFSTKYRRPSACYLAVLIFVFTLNNLQYYLSDTRIISTQTLYQYVWLPLQLAAGPLLLFYGLKLLYPDKPISGRTRLIFLPFAAALVLSTACKISWYFSPPNELPSSFYFALGAMELFAILLDQAIVGWLLLAITKNEKLTKPVAKPELGWFKTILFVFLGASFIWLFVTIQTFLLGGSPILWYLVWIFISTMIYWLGHVGIYRFGVEKERARIRSYSIEKQPVTSSRSKNDHIRTLEDLLINQKRYLDCNLSLDSLAAEMGLSKSHLSRTINAELNTGFNDYLNNLRVEEAKRYLVQPEFEHYTLLAIGLEAGFNSKTTFNTAFKKITGMTPSEYRKQALIKTLSA